MDNNKRRLIVSQLGKTRRRLSGSNSPGKISVQLTFKRMKKVAPLNTPKKRFTVIASFFIFSQNIYMGINKYFLAGQFNFLGERAVHKMIGQCAHNLIILSATAISLGAIIYFGP
jgi:hypothetical protein